MAKRNGNGSLGRKVKMSQPVAIPWDLAIDLVDAKVVKGPTVPKMEPMEKWIVSGGRSFSVSHDEGLTIVAITAPGIDGETRVEGIGETLPLATAKAIQALWRATPKPDPDGKDLPLFKAGGNGGFRSGIPAEALELEEDAGETDDGGDDNPHLPIEFDPREPDGDEDAGEAESPDWTFLFVIEPQDLARWKETPPAVDGTAIVDFDEGDGESDRGWYLNPEYAYDREVGTIAAKADPATPVWSRDAAAVSA